ncbi:MAG TPA: hypothetical protein VFQ12_07460 [Thermoleophilaceae bacterium]|nr:hypothetical protein [Thermoleophilaceae bacterium]
MKKELRPVHDALNCEVCGRTILKGERTETYLAPGGHRNLVCELCFGRAESAGWIRESAAGNLPTRLPREEQRRSLLTRLRRRREEPAQEPPPPPAVEPEPAQGIASGDDVQIPEEPSRTRTRPKDPRHVRAVPTTAEVKVERALELFNDSDHRRTIAGLQRTLGNPWISALPDEDQASAVSVVVAWELSWYRYRVDLGDESDPVMMLEKGEEIEQIDEYLREWNAGLDPSGRVLAGHTVSDGGSEG